MNNLVKGALLGGAIAGVAGLLLAPKAGSELLDDIVETYESAKKNGYDFVDAVKEKTPFMVETETENHSSMVLGIALGVVISGIASLLLAPSSGKKMRKLIGDQYDNIREKAEEFVSSVEDKGEKVIDEVSEWKEILADLFEKLSQSPSNKKGTKVNQIADLAKLGINIYQQLQGRR